MSQLFSAISQFSQQNQDETPLQGASLSQSIFNASYSQNVDESVLLYNESSDESSADEIDSNSKSTATSSKRLFKYLGHFPSSKRGKRSMAIYYDCPEISNQKELSFDGRPLKYAPGLCGYLRYPQPEISILASQRWMVRSLWEKCYFAKDFQGAVKAVQALADVDSVELADLVQFADTLRYSLDPALAVKSLIQRTIKHRLVKKHAAERSVLLGISVELLLLQSDSAAARTLLQGRISDPAFSACDHLLAFNAIIECSLAIEIALGLKSQLNDLQQSGQCFEPPTLSDVVRCPLDFAKSVLVLHILATSAPSDNADGGRGRRRPYSSLSSLVNNSTVRQQCRTALSNMKQSFASCGLQVGAAIRHPEWIDLHALYLAYLQGTQQPRAANTHIQSLVDALVAVGTASEVKREASALCVGGGEEHVTRGCQVLAAEYSARFRHPLAGDNRVLAELLGAVESLVLVASAPVYPRVLCSAVLLCLLGRMESCVLVRLVARAIEESPPSVVATSDSGYGESHLLLWQLLSGLLGPIHHDRVQEQDTAAEQLAVISVFRSECQWWGETVLSASQLGEDFSDSVPPFQARALLASIDLSHSVDFCDGPWPSDLLARAACHLRRCFADLDDSQPCKFDQFRTAIYQTLGVDNVRGDLRRTESAHSDEGGEDDEEGTARPVPSLRLLLSPSKANSSARRSESPLECPAAPSCAESAVCSSDLHDLCGVLSARWRDGWTAVPREGTTGTFSAKRSLYPFLSDPQRGVRMTGDMMGDEKVRFLQLGAGSLEILACQILVSCHLTGSQRNLFVAKGVQLLTENALYSADEGCRSTAVCLLKIIENRGIVVEQSLVDASNAALDDTNLLCVSLDEFK